MSKKMSKLDIMNTMGDAADKKSRKSSHQDDSDDYSNEAQKSIGSKMHKMKNEERPQKQKVAIAMDEARKKGLKVPSKK